MSILDQKVVFYRQSLIHSAEKLLKLAHKVNHHEMSDISEDLLQSVDEPFMFVIVGEVKVGKSSFINALLESKEEICRVAPHPMTDTIQVIRYGEHLTERSVHPFLKEYTHPAEILKEVSIVDTPGTNTIVERHQDITEDFIPKSDLVIFVFEAKNPYRESAWKFFNFIQKDWHKKLIFVLQQKDLLSTEDLKTNEEGVRQYAIKQGIAEPVIFSVSAKLEAEGHILESGYLPLREFIREKITGGRAPLLKMLSKISTAQQVGYRMAAGIEDRRAQWQSDLSFREDIRTTLDQHQARSLGQINTLVQNILDSYDSTTLKIKTELSEGLGFFSILRKSISSLFDKEQNPKQWLEKLVHELEQTLNLSLKEKLGKGVRDISESLQDMAQVAQLKIQQSETILKNDHDVFSQIAEKRARVLHDLQEAFDEFLQRTDNFYPSDMLDGGQRLSPNVATGTGIAVLGAMLTALTNGAVFDITGGVLTAVGLIFAGASLGFQRRKLLNRYTQEVARGREKLSGQVSQRLADYVDHIRLRLEQNFSKFDLHLQHEESEIQDLSNQQNEISDQLIQLKNDIETEFNITL